MSNELAGDLDFIERMHTAFLKEDVAKRVCWLRFWAEGLRTDYNPAIVASTYKRYAAMVDAYADRLERGDD